MGVVLVMFMSDGERRDFPIEGKVIVGRDSDCELQVALAEISRRHCEIKVKKDKIAVRDLGSSNGTYVNNKRIQQAPLKAGDKLTVGPVIFTVVVNGKPETIKPIKTILESEQLPQIEVKEKPAAKNDDTGSLDLDDSGELTLEDEDSSNSSSLAALEELSKQRKGKS